MKYTSGTEMIMMILNLNIMTTKMSILGEKTRNSVKTVTSLLMCRPTNDQAKIIKQNFIHCKAKY